MRAIAECGLLKTNLIYFTEIIVFNHESFLFSQLILLFLLHKFDRVVVTILVVSMEAWLKGSLIRFFMHPRIRC